MEFIISFLSEWGYLALFICMALENMNIPIPSEIILGFARLAGCLLLLADDLDRHTGWADRLTGLLLHGLQGRARHDPSPYAERRYGREKNDRCKKLV